MFSATNFREVLKNIKKQIKDSHTPVYYVADSALYTAKTIAEISPLTQWITRVPVSIAEAKFLIKKFTKEEMSSNGDAQIPSINIRNVGLTIQNKNFSLLLLVNTYNFSPLT